MNVNIDKQALRESVHDTAVALPLTVFTQYVILWFCITVMEFGPELTTIILTAVLTAFAIIRKYFIRIHYKKRNDSD